MRTVAIKNHKRVLQRLKDDIEKGIIYNYINDYQQEIELLEKEIYRLQQEQDLDNLEYLPKIDNIIRNKKLHQLDWDDLDILIDIIEYLHDYNFHKYIKHQEEYLRNVPRDDLFNELISKGVDNLTYEENLKLIYLLIEAKNKLSIP